jgi:hypothetical protein
MGTSYSRVQIGHWGAPSAGGVEENGIRKMIRMPIVIGAKPNSSFADPVGFLTARILAFSK